MPLTIRVMLVFVSIITFIFIISKIRQSKLKMEYSIIWIIGSFMIIIMSVCYKCIEWISSKIGFISPANFVFLMVCFFLILTVFDLSLKISNLKEKIKD